MHAPITSSKDSAKTALVLGGGVGCVVVLTAAPAYKCPAAPYEAAMLVEGALRRRGVRDRVMLDLYAAEPAPMGVAGRRSRPLYARWSSRRASATTPSTR